MQVLNGNLKRFWLWSEYVYVVVLLSALTQGPVLKVWEASGQIDGEIIRQAIIATYFAIQIPALLLLARRFGQGTSITGPAGVLIVFCGWMLLSTVWSTFSSYSLLESVSLFITCLAGLYLARSFTLLQQLALFAVAMQPGLLISWFAVRHDWSQAVNFGESYWIGIYFNRNSLAPAAALGLLSALALMWIVVVRRPKFWIPLAAVLADLVILDLGMLLRSKSSTSIGAIIVFVFVWIFWTAIRWFGRRREPTSMKMLRGVYSAFIICMTLLTWLSFRFQARILGLVGSNIDFSGRTILWRFSWDGFLDRVLIGWGWMAAWHTPEFFAKRDYWWALTSTNWSHSAVMDVLLGGGVVGAGLLIIAVVWGGAQQLNRVKTQIAGQWLFAATWFVIAASTQESFITGSHFLWLLLVTALVGPRQELTTAVLQQPIVPATT